MLCRSCLQESIHAMYNLPFICYVILSTPALGVGRGGYENLSICTQSEADSHFVCIWWMPERKGLFRVKDDFILLFFWSVWVAYLV